MAKIDYCKFTTEDGVIFLVNKTTKDTNPVIALNITPYQQPAKEYILTLAEMVLLKNAFDSMIEPLSTEAGIRPNRKNIAAGKAERRFVYAGKPSSKPDPSIKMTTSINPNQPPPPFSEKNNIDPVSE